MRITIVSPFDPTPRTSGKADDHVGGVERVLWQVSSRMARRGHDVTLVCSSDAADSEAIEEGIRVRRIHRRLTVLRAPLADFARHVPKDSDIVHVAATYPFTTPAVLKRAHALALPGVLDFHFEPHPDSLLGRWAASAYRLVGPPAYRLAAAVLVRSLAYGRSAPSLADVPEERWHIVPNGIDPSRFHPGGPRRLGDYLLFVGRLVPYKGLEVLLQSLTRTPDAPPLLIAGDGPERAGLQALATRLGVDARFLGRVEDADLPPLYRGARLTVLPSLNQQEAFGICLLESMACGTPVVATDLPGVEQVARLGGRVVPPGDVDRLAQALSRGLGADPIPGGRALAERIHHAYSWDAVTERMLAVYQGILARRAGG
jgi:glycosyltransferase involved in cell wall biosynthesis